MKVFFSMRVAQSELFQKKKREVDCLTGSRGGKGGKKKKS